MKKQKDTSSALGVVRSESLADFGKREMGVYTEEVNLARAVPDLIDGLKPVQRRIMWAASLLGHDFVKTARVVGDCFGAGTQVRLEDGKQIPIEELVIGDIVSTDKGPEPVVELYELPKRDLYEVVTDKGAVSATADQIFFCVDTSGKEVERTPLTLKPKAHVKSFFEETTLTPGYAIVAAVRKLPGKHTVYDIQVANRHRFYANGLLVHNCIGQYHPHGDQSVSSAITTIVQSNVPTISGKGNWGSLIDPAAAMRYTNCRLSAYGATFFGTDYIHKDVTSFVPNYDDTTREPVSLPALMPNILLNGGEGIGVGTTTMLPTFTPESVAEMMLKLLTGKKVGAEDFAKTLKYANRYGGRLVKSRENKVAWLQLFKNSSSSIQFEASLVIDRDNKAIEIDDWPKGLNPLKFIAKVRAFPGVDQAYNHVGATGFRIEVDRKLNYEQFDSLVTKVQKATQVRRSFRINVTHRKSEINDGVVTFDTKYLTLSVPQLLMAWLRERLALEKRSLEFRIRRQDEAIAYSKLLIYASVNLDVIFKALRAADSKVFLMKHLKLEASQADQILELKVRQLSKLDQDAIKEKLRGQQDFMKQLKTWFAKPKAKVCDDTQLVLAAIEKDRKFELAKDKKMSVS